MSESQIERPDGISLMATYGAVLFVAINLICRVAEGHWGSIAFMVVIVIMLLALYIRLVPLDELNDNGP